MTKFNFVRLVFLFRLLVMSLRYFPIHEIGVFPVRIKDRNK